MNSCSRSRSSCAARSGSSPATGQDDRREVLAVVGDSSAGGPVKATSRVRVSVVTFGLARTAAPRAPGSPHSVGGGPASGRVRAGSDRASGRSRPTPPSGVQLASAIVPPGRQTRSSSRAVVRVVGREHGADAGQHHVERVVGERAGPGRRPPARSRPARGPGRARSPTANSSGVMSVPTTSAPGRGGGQGGVAGARADVEHPLPGPDARRGDERPSHRRGSAPRCGSSRPVAQKLRAVCHADEARPARRRAEVRNPDYRAPAPTEDRADRGRLRPVLSDRARVRRSSPSAGRRSSCAT